ncbi:MAG: ExeM/NucH family extracellular endonuclease [Flavobacteriales bacterium]|nr:ExeM/NucH family extracellular endonuclease [Flavobacteriales bacterium]
MFEKALRTAALCGSFSALFATAQTPICAIQGAGATSPYNGQTVTTTGIVTAAFQGTGTLQGFYLEDPNCDGLITTSNGIFVYSTSITNVGVGDRMQVTGTVVEYQGLTEINNITGVVVLGTGTVTPTDITLPIASVSDWERYEGMLLRFPGTLMVTDNEDWVQYGELLMSPGRVWQPTNNTDPNDAISSGTNSTGNNNVAAINAAAALNARSSILLDDGRTNTYPTPIPWMGPQGTLRCGSTVNNLTGVLHYSYNAYRLQPAGSIPMVHAVRPDPPDVGGNILIASYNLHNYWSSLGGFGAANAGELDRQRTKLVAALVAMDADAFVLCELQNNDIAWVDLIDALNAAYGSTVYLGIEDNAGFGTKSAIFYKQGSLAPVTPLYSLYNSTFERAHITQGFELTSNGARFLLSSLHFHSKLCDNATGDNLDQSDGQGCYNARRRDQANALVTYWAGIRSTTGINAQLVMGDLNSYYQEDPVDVIRANGFSTLVPEGIANYSYRYQAVFGAIDHAFGTAELINALTGAAPWAISSDEPQQMDYPDAYLAFYQPDAYRSSDHDPLMVGLSASALVTGVEEAIDRNVDVRFYFDPITFNARWEGTDIRNVDIVDALGRSASVRVGAGTADLSDLPAGAYTWRCTMNGNGRMATGRFIKW